jgi:hypothetical protein
MLSLRVVNKCIWREARKSSLCSAKSRGYNHQLHSENRSDLSSFSGLPVRQLNLGIVPASVSKMTAHIII